MLLFFLLFLTILLSALGWTTKTNGQGRWTVQKSTPNPFQSYAVRDERMAKPMIKKVGINEREQLKNTMNEEVLRVQQLNTLLSAFNCSVTDKVQLISLESTVLSEMNEVRFKIQDEAMLLNLDSEIEKKKKQIEKETQRSEEISVVAANLQKELDASAEKVNELAIAIEEGKENDQRLLKMMVQWMKVRDERVLALISQFDDIVLTSDSLSDRNSTPPSSISSLAFPSSSVTEPISRYQQVHHQTFPSFCTRTPVVMYR